MTREDTIRLAREAGYPLAEYETGPYVPPLLETLLKHAVAAEREACAKVCDEVAKLPNDLMSDAPHIAAAIRARSNT